MLKLIVKWWEIYCNFCWNCLTYFCTCCEVVINININNILKFLCNNRHHVNSRTHMLLLLCVFNVLAFYESNNFIVFPIIMFLMTFTNSSWSFSPCTTSPLWITIVVHHNNLMERLFICAWRTCTKLI